MIRDSRPLTEFGEWLHEIKGTALGFRREEPKAFAWIAGATALVVVGIGVAGAWLGLATEPAPSSDRSHLERDLLGVWDSVVWPVMGAPLTTWAGDTLPAGPVPPAALLVVWLGLVGAVWLLACGRSVFARVVWPIHVALTAAMGYAGAAAGTELHTVAAIGVVWLVLSLPVYRRRTPRLRPEPAPSYEDTVMARIERYTTLLAAADADSRDYQTIRRRLDEEVATILRQDDYRREQVMARAKAVPYRESAWTVLFGGGLAMIGWAVMASGASVVVGAIAYVLSLGVLGVVIAAPVLRQEREATSVDTA